MKRYEYMIGTHRLGKLPDGSFAPSFVDWLNEIGAQGWHLSTMNQGRDEIMDPVTSTCVFARLIEKESAQ
jgi:hypothetical protein